MTDSDSAPTFESHLARLEAIVSRLESDDVPLNEALLLFEEGITHLQGATSVLERAEEDVRRLTEAEDGTISLDSLE
ncbi:MAG TPA: exodeoxyribonuclease VII small subunit [Gemmatimonadales bacterium]|nr:exodeoxyribonuclease VII small subunit [Gemmatimonadales bacterium]